MIEHVHRIGAALALCLMLMACGDDYFVPSMKQDYLTAYSSASGELESVITDKGLRFPVIADATHSRVKADSLVRVVCNYTEETSSEGVTGIRINALVSAVAPVPKAADTFKEGVKTDPADVLSIWMGLDYLNCILEVKAQNGAHYFHFVEEQVETDETTGHRTVSLLLYHDAGSDLQAYTQRAYLSIPLCQYASDGVSSVTVRFSLHTYEDEIKTYTFEYSPTNTN